MRGEFGCDRILARFLEQDLKFDSFGNLGLIYTLVMDGDVNDVIFPGSYCYYVAWVLLCLSLGLSVATGIRNLTTVIVYFTGIVTMLTYSEI